MCEGGSIQRQSHQGSGPVTTTPVRNRMAGEGVCGAVFLNRWASEPVCLSEAHFQSQLALRVTVALIPHLNTHAAPQAGRSRQLCFHTRLHFCDIFRPVLAQAVTVHVAGKDLFSYVDMIMAGVTAAATTGKGIIVSTPVNMGL